jgi:hypothetical protein
MNDLTMQGDKRMTTGEIAGALGVSVDKITRSAKELFPNRLEQGKTTRWTEAEVTAIKYNLRKSAEVIGLPKTELEKELLIHQAMILQQEKIEGLKKENTLLKEGNNRLQIRLSEAEQWYSVKRVLIETGREYPWKPLKEYSARHGYAVEKTFDKNYGEVNAYHRDVWHAVYGVEL